MRLKIKSKKTIGLLIIIGVLIISIFISIYTYNFTIRDKIAVLGEDIKAYKMRNAYEGTAVMCGKEYPNSLCFSSDLNSGVAYYNLDKKFKTMSGVYGTPDNSLNGSKIYIYSDNDIIEEFYCDASTSPQSFCIDVTDVELLLIETSDFSKSCIGNVSFKAK